MCSLSKEEFLARAPAFMGDILWAHLEILQKDASSANIENVPSNYSEFAIPETFQRTYTQLDSVVSENRTQYNRQYDYSNNGSTVDSNSEFSYNSRVYYNETPQQFQENFYSPYQNPSATPTHEQGGWHQPHHEYNTSTTPPTSVANSVPVSTTQTNPPMHHHPAFLQVKFKIFFYFW